MWPTLSDGVFLYAASHDSSFRKRFVFVTNQKVFFLRLQGHHKFSFETCHKGKASPILTTCSKHKRGQKKIHRVVLFWVRDAKQLPAFIWNLNYMLVLICTVYINIYEFKVHILTFMQLSLCLPLCLFDCVPAALLSRWVNLSRVTSNTHRSILQQLPPKHKISIYGIFLEVKLEFCWPEKPHRYEPPDDVRSKVNC